MEEEDSRPIKVAPLIRQNAAKHNSIIERSNPFVPNSWQRINN